MCGIAGYFGSKKIEQGVINETLHLMKRRGPNGQKHFQHILSNVKRCTFLHSRLSIIDLDHRSDQPFHYKNKTIIFNGEIYNYLEVKEKLKRLGHEFHTDSDTEVLIHALDEWGSAALNIIEGMWAFALLDRQQNTITLSRDPFGEKPLYFYQPERGEIYFGSEIKFIASLAEKKFTPNNDHICRFLVNGYKALYKTGETFFREIQELPRATCMQIDLDGAQRRIQYWHPKVHIQQDMSFAEAVEGTRERLINSVKMRLRSDVPIAFCMSGGVDSNSLISIAKRVFNYDVHGFTILNSDSRYEEQDMIDIGVKELGIKHDGFPIDSTHFFERFRELISYHDAPIITISFYLNWLLQEQISKLGYHISISGTAADELFSGYFDHHVMYFHDVQNDPILLKESIQNWERDIAPIVRNPYLQNSHEFINNPFQRNHAYLNNHKYASYLQNHWSEPFTETYFRTGLLQNRMMNELFHETTPISLHEDDLNAMYYSIENRAPFLDRDLLEFSHSIPTKHLVKQGKAKAVLREAMRGIVPDAILDNKRKVGFNAPVTDLLQTNQSSVRDYLLQDSPIFDILKMEPVAEMISQANHPNSDSKFLFSFVSAKMFLEEFS
jgi:asparagine synthase (glutamine-hydrolysing)